jgi:hypothetical protein
LGVVLARRVGAGPTSVLAAVFDVSVFVVIVINVFGGEGVD